MISEKSRRYNWVKDALDQQEGRCFYCLTPLSMLDATADHRHPISKGGKDNRANIAAACLMCNEAKADLAESWFFKLLNDKRPPRIGGQLMMVAWASRRIWRRTRKACYRIERSAKPREAMA